MSDIERRTRSVDEYEYVKTGRIIALPEKKCPACGRWNRDDQFAHYCQGCGSPFPALDATPEGGR